MAIVVGLDGLLAQRKMSVGERSHSGWASRRRMWPL